MTIKYQVTNQLTGIQEFADSFEEALKLQARLRDEYLKTLDPLFAMTVLVENEDGSWTQSLADEHGNPVIPQYLLNEVAP